jgi:transcriptional regulator with XRE-family HTH domain
MRDQDVLAAALASCEGNQSELARRLGRSKVLVGKWVNQEFRPNRGTLYRLAVVAGLDPVEVMRGTLRPAPDGEDPPEAVG